MLIYVSALVLHIYKAHRKRLYRRLALLVEEGNPSLAELLLGGREIVATLWDAHAWLWHGYELWGLENLPTEVSCGWWTVGHVTTALPLIGGCPGRVSADLLPRRPARGLLLSGGPRAAQPGHHGPQVSCDWRTAGHVTSILILIGCSVVDNFLFKVPGLKLLLEAFFCTPGTVDSIAEELGEGKILVRSSVHSNKGKYSWVMSQGLAPGGVYEAQFGDHDYNILWRERLGFARAALKANVPVLPVFTENIRESFRVLPCGGNFFYWLFMKTRLPLRPVFGGFPVKLRTHIGEPIYPEEDMTPEMLRDKCKVKSKLFTKVTLSS